MCLVGLHEERRQGETELMKNVREEEEEGFWMLPPPPPPSSELNWAKPLHAGRYILGRRQQQQHLQNAANANCTNEWNPPSLTLASIFRHLHFIAASTDQKIALFMMEVCSNYNSRWFVTRLNKIAFWVCVPAYSINQKKLTKKLHSCN